MPRPFVLILPEPDAELHEAIARELGDEAEVREPPEHYGVEAVKLFLELWAAGTGGVLGTVEIVQRLIKLRDWLRKRARPKRVRIQVLDGGDDIALIEATDEELKQLAEESRRDA